MMQCQGGWCKSRDKCAHYHALAIPGVEPPDRLCGVIEEPEPMSSKLQDGGQSLHMKLANAHRTMALASKYPMTVSRPTVHNARQVIQAYAQMVVPVAEQGRAA